MCVCMYMVCMYVCERQTDRETERVGVHMPQPIGKRWTTTLWRHFCLPTVTRLLGIEFTYSPWATLLGPSVIFLTSWPKKMPSDLCLLSVSWIHNNLGVSSFWSLFTCTSPECHLWTIWEQCFLKSSNRIRLSWERLNPPGMAPPLILWFWLMPDCF